MPDKNHSKQPIYYQNINKIKAREQVFDAYRTIMGINYIPKDRNYWTLCNWQPDQEGSEINQAVSCKLISKNQFFGVDNDIENEGIIEYNRKTHPEANWFKGDWLDIIRNNHVLFKPSLVYFDYTRTVIKSHVILSKTMNLCPSNMILAANLMLSDGHSCKRFDPNIVIEQIWGLLWNPNEWRFLKMFYSYKSSRTEMATYIFLRK